MRAAQLVSYRETMEQTTMRHLFPADLLEGVSGDLIVFDGVCVLCNGFVGFLLRRDRAGKFKFMTAQSKTGEALYARLGKKGGDYETYFFIADRVVYEKFDAVLEVMDRMGWPWRTVKPLRFLPLGLKNWLYDRIARNRYQLFGKRDQCMVPDASVRARFVE
jgi:predicted DCC family thiol-disulfide oxidoreductase YuxK